MILKYIKLCLTVYVDVSVSSFLIFAMLLIFVSQLIIKIVCYLSSLFMAISITCYYLFLAVTACCMHSFFADTIILENKRFLWGAEIFLNEKTNC